MKQNQQQRLESQQQEETFTAELQALKAEKLAIEQKIANLKEDRQRARVATIRSEISQKGEQTVAYVNSCKTDMTLEQCAKQTNTLALQKRSDSIKVRYLKEQRNLSWPNRIKRKPR